MKVHGITVLIFACIFKLSSLGQSQRMNAGNYDLCFMLQGEELHIPLKIINDSHWKIINHDEQLDVNVLPDDTAPGNAFMAELPFFRTRLRGTWQQGSDAIGYWEDLSKDSSYWVRFRISPSFFMEKESCHNAETKKFKTIFQNSSDTTEALAQFTICENRISGTFMTETGDYRHLHGVVKGNEMRFGTFDGAHLYFFKAFFHSDSITDGIFLSGNKWRQTWSAVRDENFSLRDPNHIVPPSGEVITNLLVTDASGKEVTLSSAFFENHVTIIEVMGTWCPNCMDASRFLDTMATEINDPALRVLPLLFERGDTFSQWSLAAQKFFASRERVPPYFFGGKASKKTASALFPSLTEILAFPTLIIVDGQGKIAWVHTGFYGPGTGVHYAKNKNILKKAVLHMLR